MVRNTDTPADVAARQARGEAAPPRDDEPPASGRLTRRQAIVVVHGQGMQRPMGTVRDFVKTLWVEDDRLNATPGDDSKVWIVPDGKSGLLDLQRITTAPRKGTKTDFFELYYADLLDDTPFRKLWGWMQRLLWINPRDVTPRMRPPWRAFWSLNVLVFGLMILFAIYLPGLLRSNLLLPFRDPISQIALMLTALLVAWRLLPKVFPSYTAPERIRPIIVVLFAAVGVAIAYRCTPSVGLGIALGLLYYLGTTTFLPLFGDAASYLSAQSETVGPRQQVRERGLALLMALHDDPAYERVVVVAHSLGTVLAYDLLTFMWHAVGPTKENPPNADVIDAIDAVDAFARRVRPGGWTPKTLEAYRALQWRAFDALTAQKAVTGGVAARRAGWKISDFVSLGSPLSSAQFLVTEGEAEFEKLKEQRVMPTSPPVRYDEHNSSLYHDHELARRVAHHAAVFSVVRWTNVYDEFDRRWIVPGDAFSGPLARTDLFGPAICDRQVRITFPGVFRRRLTHNHYWVNTTHRPGVLPRHIRVLRKAVDIAAWP